MDSSCVRWEFGDENTMNVHRLVRIMVEREECILKEVSSHSGSRRNQTFKYRCRADVHCTGDTGQKKLRRNCINIYGRIWAVFSRSGRLESMTDKSYSQ